MNQFRHLRFATVVLSLLACGPRPPHAVSGDSRTAIAVDPEVQGAVRAEMRTMLTSLHDVLAATTTGDTAAIRTAATR